jgi:hypothetical protein
MTIRVEDGQIVAINPVLERDMEVEKVVENRDY